MFAAAIPYTCPFCAPQPERIVAESLMGFVIRDAYPVSPGHTLVIPRRHIASFFELETDERDGLMDLLEKAKTALDLELRPDAYNIGINDGKDAGQTIAHLHIHLIPRYQGDQQDPRGGIRWLFPEKARYWA
jgi:diadenosine tetraphosphate (Ap4A) HIT family hydrolase